MKFNIYKCPKCGQTPIPEPIEMSTEFKCSCACLLTCMGATRQKAVDCWNRNMQLTYPTENLEVWSVKVEA